jgi:mannonate dehydratase
MRIGMGRGGPADAEFLRMCSQIGVQDIVINNPSIPIRDGRWELVDIFGLRANVEAAGLKLTAIENTPITMRDHIIAGGPKRDEQIENMIATVRNIARAGIPIYTYSWKYPRIYRTPLAEIRGGAQATAWDSDLAADWPDILEEQVTEDEAWENLEYWIKAITPVAEEEGIRLGMHPADPPIPTVSGFPQLFRSFDAYKRLIEIVDSPFNAILFCQGSCSEMADAADGGIYEMIEYFTSRNRILYVHFRNVSGTVPKFHEEFINTGYVDMYRAMRMYHENGFEGFFMDDHVPITVGDSALGYRAKCFANGYIQALIETVTNKSLQGAH